MTDEAITDMVSRGVCKGLASRRPWLYPRHRWTGSDLSCDEIGLFEACCGLLTSSYSEFLARVDGSRKARSARVSSGGRLAALVLPPAEAPLPLTDIAAEEGAQRERDSVAAGSWEDRPIDVVQRDVHL